MNTGWTGYKPPPKDDGYTYSTPKTGWEKFKNFFGAYKPHKTGVKDEKLNKVPAAVVRKEAIEYKNKFPNKFEAPSKRRARLAKEQQEKDAAAYKANPVPATIPEPTPTPTPTPPPPPPPQAEEPYKPQYVGPGGKPATPPQYMPSTPPPQETNTPEPTPTPTTEESRPPVKPGSIGRFMEMLKGVGRGLQNRYAEPYVKPKDLPPMEDLGYELKNFDRLAAQGVSDIYGYGKTAYDYAKPYASSAYDYGKKAYNYSKPYASAAYGYGKQALGVAGPAIIKGYDALRGAYNNIEDRMWNGVESVGRGIGRAATGAYNSFRRLNAYEPPTVQSGRAGEPLAFEPKPGMPRPPTRREYRENQARLNGQRDDI
jgi:hypothetical protein